MPSSMPTYVEEGWGQIVWDKKRRIRNSGICDNACSGHGQCTPNNNCKCFADIGHEEAYTGPDCSLRTCPKDIAWVGEVVMANGKPIVHLPAVAVPH